MVVVYGAVQIPSHNPFCPLAACCLRQPPGLPEPTAHGVNACDNLVTLTCLSFSGFITFNVLQARSKFLRETAEIKTAMRTKVIRQASLHWNVVPLPVYVMVEGLFCHRCQPERPFPRTHWISDALGGRWTPEISKRYQEGSSVWLVCQHRFLQSL